MRFWNILSISNCFILITNSSMASAVASSHYYTLILITTLFHSSLFKIIQDNAYKKIKKYYKLVYLFFVHLSLAF